MLTRTFLVTAAVASFTTVIYAQTSVWSGAHASSANWNVGANWVGGTPPSPGDTLVFPAVAARKVNTNNFASSTAFKLISFGGGGYQIHGNQVILTSDVDDLPFPGDAENIIQGTASGTNSIFLDILIVKTNGSVGIQMGAKSSNLLNIYGDINLAFNPTVYFESGLFVMAGRIQGTGNVQVYPSASVIYSDPGANNSYNGYTAVSGELSLNKGSSIPGDVVLSAVAFFPQPGNLVWWDADQIADASDVTFWGSMKFLITNDADTVRHFSPVFSVFIEGGRLNLNGDVIPTGNFFVPEEPCMITSSNLGGRLGFNAGNHSIIQTGLISGLVLDIPVTGPGNINKTGTNTLWLVRSNNFSGVFTINDGPVVISNNWSLGSTAGNTVVGSGGTLFIGRAASNIHEALVLQPGSTLTRSPIFVTSRLNGPIAVPGPGTPVMVDAQGISMFMTNAISGSGNLRLSAGTFSFGGSFNNSLSGTITLTDGANLFLSKTNGAIAINGPLVIGDGNPTNGFELGQIDLPEQIADTMPVTVLTNATFAVFENETIASLSGNGRATIGGASALTVGYGGASFEFTGYFYAGGYLEKIGAGTGILSGNSPTFEGEINIYDGTMDIRAFYAGATATVYSRLTGNGSVGHLYVQNGGVYQPGRSKKDGLNVMTSSNLNLAAGAILRVAIWGGGSNQHGRASVKGIVNITNAVLDVKLLAPPPVGAEFKIIDNDGIEPVNGTFAGLPGGVFTGPGGLKWEIEYGNDVIIRLLSQGLSDLPPTFEGEDFLDIIVQGGNGDEFVNPNECIQLYIPIYNETMMTTDVGQVTLISYFEDLLVHQPYSLYPELPPGGGAYNITPFQVSVPKGFQCGTNLPMALVIKQGTNAPYALPVGLPTGEPAAAPLRIDSSGPLAIPDESLLIDFVFVPNFTGHLAKAEVSLHINHPALDMLSVTLVGPGEIVIPLSIGKSGSSYGTGCADNNRTLFTANSDTFIGDAAAPYVGEYRPVGIMQLLRGMPENVVENRWYLYVEDTASGNVGTLECWSLFLYPAECEEGEGLCEFCPAPISDSVDLMELPGAGRLARFDVEAEPTACGDEPVLDYFAAPGDFYYKTYTFYNQSEAETCVSVTLYTSCTGANAIVSSAHLGGYNPPLAWTNVLGYIGETPDYNTSPRMYSFTAPGLAEITIVVSATTSFTPCSGFTLHVMGPDLCPAELFIRPAGEDKVKLDWSTGAAGYLLQKNTSMMAPTNWAFVPDTPVVSGDRFVVTNEPINPHAFFRLLKP